MAARDLPVRPSLEQYKKQAKDLLKNLRSADPDALERARHHHPRLGKLPESELARARFTLADAQFVLAREHGFDSWPRFARQINAVAGENSPSTVWKLAENAIVAGDTTTLERLLRDHEQLLRKRRPQSAWLGGLTPDYSSPDARSIIAANHDFESWDQFAQYAAALNDRNSAVAQFEAAVDAIVAGHAPALERLLRNRDLIRARSTRKHHSTLLHYVGANGVEGFRQRTPNNAVQIAEMLLNAGAEVDAGADMYGGATTLGLVATSIHPKLAGLQEALLDTLLAHGARMDHPRSTGNAHSLVNGCLANGRDEAARFLASRGAPLDFEGAAGLGQLDIVRSFFTVDDSLKPTATPAQMRDGFLWACSSGHTSTVVFLLEHGMLVDVRLRRHGETGLHAAAIGGHVDTVTALLERHAPLDVKDDTFGGTPLGWVLYHWGGLPESTARGLNYYDIVASLIGAGATVDWEWLASPDRGMPLDEKVRADPRMFATLHGEAPEIG